MKRLWVPEDPRFHFSPLVTRRDTVGRRAATTTAARTVTAATTAGRAATGVTSHDRGRGTSSGADSGSRGCYWHTKETARSGYGGAGVCWGGSGWQGIARTFVAAFLLHSPTCSPASFSAAVLIWRPATGRKRLRPGAPLVRESESNLAEHMFTYYYYDLCIWLVGSSLAK